MRNRQRQGQRLPLRTDEHHRLGRAHARFRSHRRPRHRQTRRRTLASTRSVEQNGYLRAACQRLHRQRAMAAQRTSRHLRGPRTPGHALIPAGSGRHLHRTAADSGQTIGTLPAGTRTHQLLGILHARIFRPRILICHQTLARGRSGRSTARSHQHGARIARGRL